MDESKGQAGGVLTPVAWGKNRFIEDRDGRRIGTDEPEVVWGKEPPDDSGGWFPLFTRPTPAAAADTVTAKDVAALVVSAVMGASDTVDFAGVPTGWKLVPVEPTPEMVQAYLTANDAYWHRTDRLPEKPGKWRRGTPSEATAESYVAMLAASPVAPAGAPTEFLTMAEQCGATVYRNRANIHQPAVAFGDESWARFVALLSAGSQGEQHDSSHEAAPQSSVASPAPRSSLPLPNRSVLPREPL